MKYLRVTMLATAIGVVFGLAYSLSTEFQARIDGAWKMFWSLPQRNAIIICVVVILAIAWLATRIRPNVTRKGFYE